MAFSGSDVAYDRFMGRFSRPLAPLFADFAGVETAMDALDVGCGPGALTEELVRRLGARHVTAVDPTDQFVIACRERFPEVTVAQAGAEDLPFADSRFDAALAQLVVSFMADAVAGIREMARVTRPGGVVGACMWASGPEMELLHLANSSAESVAPGHPGVHAPRRYRTEPELVELFGEAGLRDVRSGSLEVTAEYADFDELLQSVFGGSGPVGAIIQTLDEDGRRRFGTDLRERLGDRREPFRLSGRAWAVRGVRGGDHEYRGAAPAV
jgi:SAM-dependent methyltransferase